jgi:hypothetical protein
VHVGISTRILCELLPTGILSAVIIFPCMAATAGSRGLKVCEYADVFGNYSISLEQATVAYELQDLGGKRPPYNDHEAVMVRKERQTTAVL